MKFKIVIFSFLLYFLRLNLFAYDVWLGTTCTPQSAALNTANWSLVAKKVTGLNINLSPCLPTLGTPNENDVRCTSENWRTVLSQYTIGKSNGLVPLPRSAFGPVGPHANLTVGQVLQNEMDEAASMGYTVSSFMFYDNSAGGVSYKWTVEEVQEMRNWLDTNGYTSIRLLFDARNNGIGVRNWCSNSLVDEVLLEMDQELWDSNAGSRHELLQWLWTNTNKRLIFQLTTQNGDPYGTPSSYQKVRQLVNSINTFMGVDYAKSSRVVYMPVTYNTTTYQFAPEKSEDGLLYKNTLTSLALSLIEQKAQFESVGGVTLEFANSYVRSSITAFSPDNFVVSRTHNSGAVMVTGTAYTTELLEYTPTGDLVQLINLSTPTPSGQLTLYGLNNSEGQLNLSQNKHYLSILGYNTVSGNTSGTGSTDKVVARLSANAEVDLNTKFAASSLAGNVRTLASIDGSTFWVGSSTGGIRYVPYNNAVANTATLVSNTATNVRYLNLFNDQLYANVSANTNYSTVAVNPGTPTNSTATSITQLPGLSVLTTPEALVFFDVDNNGTPDLLYLADAAGNLIRKYSYESNTWTARGTVVATTITGITGKKEGASYSLYFIAGTQTSGGGNSIQKLTDVTAFNADFSATLVTTLVTAPANYGLRGISFTPTTSILPVNLTSFKGEKTAAGIMLSWTTASETNNDRFDILQSTGKDNFQLISSVKGKGKASQYSYVDATPASGVNYYKLNQVDFDGTVTPSDVIAVKSDLSSSESTLSVSEGILKYSINSNSASTTSLQIFNMNGSQVSSTNLNLQAGLNQGNLSVVSLNNGVYVARFTIDGKVVSKKFIK